MTTVRQRFPSARRAALALLVATIGLAAAPAALAQAASKVLNVYNWSDYIADDTIKNFEKETGIKVNVIFAEKGLIERIQAEWRNSPADVLLTVDVGNLTQATDAGIAQPVAELTPMMTVKG